MRINLRESLEIAVEDNWEEMATETARVQLWKENLVCDLKTLVRLLQIRFQDTTSEDWEDLACP
jgi:hypothetical protein